MQGIRREMGLMRIYIMVGVYEKALPLIPKMIDHKLGYFNINILKQSPIYDPLRDLPEFQAILEDPKYQISELKFEIVCFLSVMVSFLQFH